MALEHDTDLSATLRVSCNTRSSLRLIQTSSPGPKSLYISAVAFSLGSISKLQINFG